MIENRDFFHIPRAFDAPVSGVSVGKATMVWLPDGENVW